MSTETPKWYIIHTYSTYETLVEQSLENLIKQNNLEDYILKIHVPIGQEAYEKDGKRKVKEVKKFPGYVFLKMLMTEKLWGYITNIRGVTGFVGFSGKPTPLSDEEAIRLGLDPVTIEEWHINVGDEIIIVSGPLDGIVGKVVSLNMEKEKAKVMVNMMGQKTPVDLNFNQIKKTNTIN